MNIVKSLDLKNIQLTQCWRFQIPTIVQFKPKPYEGVNDPRIHKKCSSSKLYKINISENVKTRRL